MLRPETLIDDLRFPEGPRWHDGRLWFSDMHSQQVLAVDLDGKAETIVEVPQDPSGLGWLPDGRLLVVSMQDRKLMRLDPQGLVEVADLSAHASFYCNDMVVDAVGRAYVGNFGWDLHGGAPPVEANLVLVEPDGAVRVVADKLRFPNGSVITPDGRTLIVGETFGPCLTAFDIAGDGSLSGRREWARMEGAVPDGICLDAEGGIWVASPVSGAVLRLVEGGRVRPGEDAHPDGPDRARGGADPGRRPSLSAGPGSFSPPDRTIRSGCVRRGRRVPPGRPGSRP